MFSQRDERWANIPLGTYGGQTIGNAGCLMVDNADILRECEVDTDPGRFNRWLCRNNGYTSGNLFVFGAIQELLPLTVTVVDYSRSPADIERMKSVLADEGFVIAKVDFYPGGTVQQHWVRVLRIDDEDALIMDPWLEYGNVTYLMPRYARHDWDSPSRAIWRVAYYEWGKPKAYSLESQAKLSPMSGGTLSQLARSTLWTTLRRLGQSSGKN